MYEQLVSELAQRLRQRQWLVATAESCTGGLLAGELTALAGSSEWFDRGFVTYSNEAKQECLGVDMHVIRNYGAVSEQTVCAMAAGVLSNSRAQLSVSISGVAGPGGGTERAPVGTVWFGFASPMGVNAVQHWLDGDRLAVRQAAVRLALEGLLRKLAEG